MEGLPKDRSAALQRRNDLGIVIAAGGASARFGSANKLLQHYLGVPLFIHSLSNFSTLCNPGNLVLVVPAGEIEEFKQCTGRFLPDCKVRLVPGGTTRTLSVRNGIDALNNNIGYVAIHDAARPLTTPELLLRCLTKAESIQSGAVPAKPVTDTLRKADENGILSETVSRENLWRMETPQVFKLASLREAFNLAVASRREFTDDAAVMQFAGYLVAVVPHLENNLKVTYPEDFAALPALSATKSKARSTRSETNSKF